MDSSSVKEPLRWEARRLQDRRNKSRLSPSTWRWPRWLRTFTDILSSVYRTQCFLANAHFFLPHVMFSELHHRSNVPVCNPNIPSLLFENPCLYQKRFLEGTCVPLATGSHSNCCSCYWFRGPGSCREVTRRPTHTSPLCQPTFQGD